MIIDARERFSSNAKKKNIATALYTGTAKVVQLVQAYQKNCINHSTLQQATTETPAAVSHHPSHTLRKTFGAMIFRSTDITAAFYKRLANPQLWDKPQFTSLVAADSGELMSALMGMAYNPPRPALMERFLKEARLKFHGHRRTPRDDHAMAAILVSVIDEVNRNHWDQSTQMAWQNALHADNIFTGKTLANTAMADPVES